MALEQSLFTYLNTLGDAYKGVLPDRPTYPSLLYMRINEEKQEAVDNSEFTQTNSLYQIDITGPDSDALTLIARSIQGTQNGFVGDFYGTIVTNMVVSLLPDSFENDYKLSTERVELRIYQ